MIDPFALEKVDCRFDVSPVFAEFARVRRDVKACIARHEVGLPEVLGLVVGFAVVDPETDRFGFAVRDHFADELNGILRRRLAVDRGHEAPDHAVAGFALAKTLADGALSGFKGHEVLEARPVPEEFDVAHALLRNAFHMLDGNALQVFGLLQNVGFERAEDAAKAFIEARAEGEAVFGDGECYMEKFVAPAHHVEVQIMADKQGHVFSLGERECSVQRRNQKLIEESPAPCLDGHDDIRARMHKAARDLARAVGYEGAGTIEFLYSDDGNFYFMEMNTRLQVEHPVTEFVTDTDLVKWQLRVAAGLPFEQEDMPVRNHAMECRINAETPDFLPSCGTVTALRVPGGPRVRWDSAMFAGAKVPPYYDSMLGKLIVCAPTRDGAIRKMRSALGELVIEGVSENSELQLDVLANDEFLSGMYHTDLMGHLYADE